MDTIDQSKLMNAVLKKTRIQFSTRVCVITLLILCFFSLGILGINEAIFKIKYDGLVRMHGNINQFTQPVSTVGYSNNGHKIGAIVNSYIGRSMTGGRSQSNEATTTFFYKLKVYDKLGNSFSMEASEDNIETTKVLLEKNDNQVAVANISFIKEMNMNEIKSILGQYEVQLHWFAVKTGLENKIPKNISFDSMSGELFHQFGFPAMTSVGTSLELKQLDYNNPNEYLDYIRSEWKWCLDHKRLVKNSKDLILFEDMKAALEDEIQIYGVTLFGTTEELTRLCEDDNIGFVNISAFYPWDFIKSSISE